MKVMLCMLRKFFSHNLKHFQRYCKLLKFGLFYPTLHFSNKGGLGLYNARKHWMAIVKGVWVALEACTVSRS